MKPAAAENVVASRLVTPRAWSVAYVSYWQTRSTGTWAASGSWCPSICGWERGTCCAAGSASLAIASRRDWPCNWFTKQRFVPLVFSGELLADLHRRNGIDLLVPLPSRKVYRERFQAIAEDQFTRHWAGYATAKMPREIKQRNPGQYHQFAQRFGERPDQWTFNGFLCTGDRDEVKALTRDFPSRWHVEEFFNANQALGRKRGGTMNLNIRYGQMTTALIAQAAIHQLRQRLGKPYCTWARPKPKQTLFKGQINYPLKIAGWKLVADGESARSRQRRTKDPH